MPTYYQVSTVYQKLDDEGQQKQVAEQYLVDAQSCSDAELLVTKDVQPFAIGGIEIPIVRKTSIIELFDRDVEGKWYACRLAMITINNKGKEKRTAYLIYVKAKDVRDAEVFVMGELAKGMQDWVVVNVGETKVIAVIENGKD